VRLEVQNLSWCAAGGVKILDSVDLQVAPGSFTGIIGPNGSGKSSLLKCIYGVIAPDSGAVHLDGEDIRRMKGRQLARKIAVVLQETVGEVHFTVLEIVLMGRHPHRHPFEGYNEEDLNIARESLTRVGLEGMEKRPFPTLSGGEKQRVLLARALTQRAPLLVLDEPTNHLDIRHAVEVLSLIQSMGITTLAVLHDLNLAAFYCDSIHVLSNGRIEACGAPGDVLTARLIRRVFGIQTLVETHPITGRLSVTLLPAGWAQGRLTETAGPR